MADLSCDVAVIGAGTAGLAAARSALACGAHTLLIDEAFAGTLCATTGCMPSKLLIAAAHAAEDVRRSSMFGIGTGAMTIDGAAVMRRVRAERDRFVDDVKESFTEFPEGTCIKARAKFAGTTTLDLDDGRSVEAKAVVIATGSHPAIPQPFRDLGSLALTNRSVFELADLPRRLAIVGAGPVGLELAQAMARLGVTVFLFDAGETLGKVGDDEVHAALQSLLESDLEIHLGVDLDARREGDRACLRWSGRSEGEADFDAVLLATGRPPSLQGLDLDKAGLELDSHGAPRFEPATMQCGTAPVFIAGDANGDLPVLHEASREGAIAGRNAAHFPDVASSRRATPFTLIFTDPPVALVGERPRAPFACGNADFGRQGRARVASEAVGLLRIYCSMDGRLTGAELCAPGGEHLAHHLAWAIERGDSASDLLSMPFYHPTFEEGLKSALQDVCKTLHTSLPPDQDRAGPPGG